VTSGELPTIDLIRSAFDMREAIYIERGVLKVRVMNIRHDANKARVTAEVEEIPTPGLEESLFHERNPNAPCPLRWTIAAGRMSTFSEHTWKMGYGGWSLFFAPEIVAGMTKIVAGWGSSLNPQEFYTYSANQFILEKNAHEPSMRVFQS